MRIIKIVPAKIKKIVPEINSLLKKGKVLVLPTDTVYGLVCDASNEKAVEKIFQIKERDKSKPLAVFVGNVKMAERYAFINHNQKIFLVRNWPGQITVVLKAKKGLAGLVYRDDTIGLRQPEYKLIEEILKSFKKPLAQTSANISGESALTKIKDILEQFENNDIQPDIIVSMGDLPIKEPSKVVEYINNKIKTLRK